MLVTCWTSNSSEMTGGITYYNGYITVPMDGVYYVYAQLLYNPKLGHGHCGFSIYQNRDRIGSAYKNTGSSLLSSASQYTGITKIMMPGDKLSVRVNFTAHYSFADDQAVFGCFRL